MATPVPALGRPFMLGCLYDCRDETIIPGMTLWDLDQLNENVQKKSNSSTNYKFQYEDTYSAKGTALGVDASLKLNILGGLVQVGGSAHYLHDEKSSTLHERISLHYDCLTEFENLTMSHLGKGNAKHPDIFDNDIATHVVTGIQYGSSAIFVFDRQQSENEKTTELSGSMKAVLSIIPGLGVEGEASLKMNTEEQAQSERISCRLFSEGFKDLSTVSTFAEAAKLYQTLPEFLDPVPTKVFLYPLGMLDSKPQKIVREISIGLVDQAVAAIEALQYISLQAKGLLANNLVMKFSVRIKQHIQNFDGLVKQNITQMKNKYLQVLPKIRKAALEEIQLAKILSAWQQSPFNITKLQNWVDSIAMEVDILDSCLQQLHLTADIIKSRGELMPYYMRWELKKLVCLAIRTTDTASNFVRVLKSSIDGEAVDTQDGEQGAWYAKTETLQNMARKLRAFHEYADFVKKSNTAVKCFVFEDCMTTAEGLTETPGAAISLYEEGQLTDSDHMPLGPPQIEKQQGAITALESGTFRLTCKIKGIFVAKVEWFKDCTPIVSTGKYAILNTPTETTLEVRDARLKVDEGTYTAKLRNEAGLDEQQFNVDIQASTDKVPIGTIAAWTPFVQRSVGQVGLPRGWQLCDGSTITDDQSPWKGQATPNLNQRFLRGGNMSDVLNTQADQLQDHEHHDPGHSHTDQGHTHTDSGHTHTDAGHSHAYTDSDIQARGSMCSGQYWHERHITRTTSTGYANIQRACANITRSCASLTRNTSNIGGVKAGVRGARLGNETRPMATFVMWIIKIVQ